MLFEIIYETFFFFFLNNDFIAFFLCKGVCYHKLGGEENLRIAIRYHRQHRRIATDVYSRVIGLCNEGLAYRKLGDISKAEV